MERSIPREGTVQIRILGGLALATPTLSVPLFTDGRSFDRRPNAIALGPFFEGP